MQSTGCKLKRYPLFSIIHEFFFVYRITELQNCWSWKGPLKAIQSNCPALNRDTDSSIGAQSPVQPDLNNLQGWGIHYLSGQPVPHRP